MSESIRTQFHNLQQKHTRQEQKDYYQMMECSICMQYCRQTYICTYGNHIFCKKEIKKLQPDPLREVQCPVCRNLTHFVKVDYLLKKLSDNNRKNKSIMWREVHRLAEKVEERVKRVVEERQREKEKEERKQKETSNPQQSGQNQEKVQTAKQGKSVDVARLILPPINTKYKSEKKFQLPPRTKINARAAEIQQERMKERQKEREKARRWRERQAINPRRKENSSSRMESINETQRANLRPNVATDSKRVLDIKKAYGFN